MAKHEATAPANMAHLVSNAEYELDPVTGVPILVSPLEDQVAGDFFDKVTRVEIIDSTGRAFTAYYQNAGVELQLQDQGRTLKLFTGVPK